MLGVAGLRECWESEVPKTNASASAEAMSAKRVVLPPIENTTGNAWLQFGLKDRFGEGSIAIKCSTVSGGATSELALLTIFRSAE